MLVGWYGLFGGHTSWIMEKSRYVVWYEGAVWWMCYMFKLLPGGIYVSVYEV